MNDNVLPVLVVYARMTHVVCAPHGCGFLVSRKRTWQFTRSLVFTKNGLVLLTFARRASSDLLRS